MGSEFVCLNHMLALRLDLKASVMATSFIHSGLLGKTVSFFPYQIKELLGFSFRIDLGLYRSNMVYYFTKSGLI